MCESRRVLCNEISIKRVPNLIVFSCDATISFNDSVFISVSGLKGVLESMVL